MKYYVKGNNKDITTILKRYYPSIWSKWSNRLAELFFGFIYSINMEAGKKNMIKSDIKKAEEREEGDHNS